MRKWGPSRVARFEEHIRKFGIYPYDGALCRVWADVCHGAQKKGRPIGTSDARVAATALLHDLPLVTHNASDYGGVDGLTIITEPDE